MLTRVIGAVMRAGLAGAAVVTGDWETARLADELRARVLHEERPGLNAAVRQGLAWVERRARAALVLPSDLPLVEAEELLGLLGVAPQPPGTVLCPSADGGTNALLLRPPPALQPAFGPHSAQRHAAAAEAAGLSLVWHTRPGLALDVDSVADLNAYRTLGAYRSLAGEPLRHG